MLTMQTAPPDLITNKTRGPESQTTLR